MKCAELEEKMHFYYNHSAQIKLQVCNALEIFAGKDKFHIT